MINSQNRIYPASWDKTVQVITVITSVIMLLVSVTILVAAFVAPISASGRAALGAAAVVLPALIMWNVIRLSVKDYALTPTDIVIRRRRGQVCIPLANIARVEVADGAEVFARCVKGNASGGLFGLYGTFSSPGMGGRDFVAYANRTSGPMVVLRLIHGDPVVLSPDDVDGFAAAVNASLARTDRS